MFGTRYTDDRSNCRWINRQKENRLDYERILRDLYAEKSRLEQVIAALEELYRSRTSEAVGPPGSPRKGGEAEASRETSPQPPAPPDTRKRQK